MMLEALQREMAAAVMAPLTVRGGMRGFTADGRNMAEAAGGFIAPNSRLSSFERLEIYNRQYWRRLLDAFTDDFTALAAVLGKRRFTALAIRYLTDCPSVSFTLRNLGSRLTAWIEANPNAVGRRRSLALDVARLEWANVEAFDGAEFAPLTTEEIAALSGASRIGVQPHVRLLELDHCIDNFVIGLHEAFKNKEELEDPPCRPDRSVSRKRRSLLAAHRSSLSVYYRRLSREEHALLTALRAGLPLSEAIESAFASSRIPVSRRAETVAVWFHNWSSLGWLTMPEKDMENSK